MYGLRQNHRWRVYWLWLPWFSLGPFVDILTLNPDRIDDGSSIFPVEGSTIHPVLLKDLVSLSNWWFLGTSLQKYLLLLYRWFYYSFKFCILLSLRVFLSTNDQWLFNVTTVLLPFTLWLPEFFRQLPMHILFFRNYFQRIVDVTFYFGSTHRPTPRLSISVSWGLLKFTNRFR